MPIETMKKSTTIVVDVAVYVCDRCGARCEGGLRVDRAPLQVHCASVFIEPPAEDLGRLYRDCFVCKPCIDEFMRFAKGGA